MRDIAEASVYECECLSRGESRIQYRLCAAPSLTLKTTTDTNSIILVHGSVEECQEIPDASAHNASLEMVVPAPKP